MNIKLASTVHLNAYGIISDAVDDAVAYGWRRAHKYSETPSEEAVHQEIHTAVMNSLCGILKFHEE